jgi:hypothetical protein
MGATRESPSLTDAAELDELRRRAYGPEADIQDDASAIARLSELESLHGHGRPSLAGTPRDATSAPPENTAPTPPEASADSRRRGGRVAAIGLTVALVLVPAAVVSILTTRSSDVTLYQRSDVPPDASAQLSMVGQLGYLGIARSEVRLYDHYRGLNVWSAPRGAGSTCLFVTSTTPPRWRVDCTSWDRRPTIDLLQYREDSRLSGFEALGDVPAGHVLRLALQDGAVVVTVVEAPVIADEDN